MPDGGEEGCRDSRTGDGRREQKCEEICRHLQIIGLAISSGSAHTGVGGMQRHIDNLIAETHSGELGRNSGISGIDKPFESPVQAKRPIGWLPGARDE